MIGRFAPSPTGAMHLGNARTALLAWLHTRAHGGEHLLRFEDLDTGRVRPAAYDLTRRDLAWLGLTWDREERQSEQTGRYAAALARLDHYACRCTRRELLLAAQDPAGAPHGPETPYPGTCRERGWPHAGAALRWRVPAGESCAFDAYRSERQCRCSAELGDPVLRRRDGVYAYHLAVVTDDAHAGITDVLRGDDLWPVTPLQVALQRALGLPTPRYLHVPLLRDFRGERLAKRGGAPPLSALREAGETPGRVRAELARSLGWAVPPEVGLDELTLRWRAELQRRGAASRS